VFHCQNKPVRYLRADTGKLYLCNRFCLVVYVLRDRGFHCLRFPLVTELKYKTSPVAAGSLLTEIWETRERSRSSRTSLDVRPYPKIAPKHPAHKFDPAEPGTRQTMTSRAC